MPGPAEEVARAHQEDRQLLGARAVAAAVRTWQAVDLDDIAGSWALEVPRLTAIVTAGQRAAASSADRYIDEALDAQGAIVVADGLIDADGFAGIASDGRPLGSLLTSPAFTSLRQIAVGLDPVSALASGRHALTAIVGTQIADAGRVADGVATFARPGTKYVRAITTPTCSRCAVLAGQVYESNVAFDRHPRCDCIHVPILVANPESAATDTDAYFASLSEGEQNRIFTNAGAQAIRDGADIGQVVNARRGMNAAGFTSEGLTRRGAARRAQNRAGVRTRRPMPEQIYANAGDRDEALELLRVHGYLA